MNGARNALLDRPIARAVVSMSAPMLVSGVLQNAQSLIDLFWVGRLGARSVAAVAMSGTVLMAIFPLVMGAATGTLALVSRAVGRGDGAEASRAAAQSVLTALGLGAVTAAVGVTLLRPAWRLLGADPEVAALAGQYMGIQLCGIFTANVLFVANSALQGSGNAVLPMWGMLLSNAINMALDPVLIFGLAGFPAMGVRGAALATVAAQAGAACVVLGALARGAGALRLRRGLWRPDFNMQWRILRIGVPSSGQMLTRSLMGLVLMRIVASCGTAAVAAYGIVLRFNMILLLPAFAVGNSSAALVGQNLGANRPGRAARTVWIACGLEVGLMAVSAAALWTFGPGLVGVFSRDPRVIEVGARFLRIAAPSFVFAALAIVMGRSMQGAGDAVPPMLSTIVSLWGLQVPLAVALSRVWNPPTDGIWWAHAIATVSNGLMNAAWFMTGRWQHKRV